MAMYVFGRPPEIHGLMLKALNSSRCFISGEEKICIVVMHLIKVFDSNYTWMQRHKKMECLMPLLLPHDYKRACYRMELLRLVRDCGRGEV